MCKKRKRVNFDRHEDSERLSKLTGGLVVGVELSTSSDGLAITPVNASGKLLDSRTILVPLGNLDEFAQSVQTYLEEVERDASQQS